MSTREVTPEELTFLKLKYDWDDSTVRTTLAVNGIALNILVHDKIPFIRSQCVGHGYGLDILRDDPNSDIRKIVEVYERSQRYQKAKSIVDGIFKDAGCL